MRRLVLAAAIVAIHLDSAQATTGPGCLIVVNVASNDTLNMRAKPSAQSRVVDVFGSRPSWHHSS